MVIHNFLGSSISMPVYGCLPDYLTTLGVLTSATGPAKVSGEALVDAAYAESLNYVYRTDALTASPPSKSPCLA